MSALHKIDITLICILSLDSYNVIQLLYESSDTCDLQLALSALQSSKTQTPHICIDTYVYSCVV